MIEEQGLRNAEMSVHSSPRQCLANLTQQQTDGGRAEFLEQEWRSAGTEPEAPTGDCAVVALVHATFRSPSGQAYRESMFDLSSSTRPWMYKMRTKGEKPLDFLYRRFQQWLRAPRRNPIHGTPSHATGFWTTTFLRYELIYPNKENHWHCICDMKCTYVLDVQIPGDHTMTVHQRVAYTTAPFDPNETEVGNVHRLNARRTKALKARRQYEEDDQLWFQQWAEGGGFQLSDWNSRPKLEDYLRN